MGALAGVDAVILAGGKGKRLRSVVADRPKVLAEVAGKPFICYLLDYLGTSGIRRAVLCTGFMADLVSDTLGDSYNGIELKYSREDEPMDTAGAVRLALPKIQSDPALVLNGDSFYRADMHGFHAFYTRNDAKGTLMLAEVEDVQRYGSVRIDESGRIVAFEEKLANTGRGLVSAGIYLLSRDLLESIPDGGPASFEREVFPSWVNHGLFGFPNKGMFLDIGTPESFLSAQAFFGAQ